MATKLITQFTPITVPAVSRLMTVGDEITGARFKLSITDFFENIAANAQFSGSILSNATDRGLHSKDTVGNEWRIGSSGGDFWITEDGAAVTPLKLATSTGIATFVSEVIATKFKTPTGLTSEFLKANGDIDSSVYLTAGDISQDFLPLGGGTLTGALFGTSHEFSSTFIQNGLSNFNNAVNINEFALNIRKDSDVDGGDLEEINFLNSSAQGVDDHAAIIRAFNSGGASENRGGGLKLITRSPNSGSFVTALTLDSVGAATFTGTVDTQALTATTGTFSGDIFLTKSLPKITYNDTGGAVDQKIVRIRQGSGLFGFLARNDANSATTHNLLDFNLGTGAATFTGAVTTAALTATTGTFTDQVDITSTATAATLIVDRNLVTVGGMLNLQSEGVSQIQFRNTTTYTTLRAGSGLGFQFQPDAGALNALQITSAGDATFAGNVTVGDGVGTEIINIDGGAGSSRDIRFQTNGSNRWIMTCNNTAEGGSDAGSNWELKNRSDAGAALSTVLSFDRATGDATFTGDVAINVSGATTTLNVGSASEAFNNNVYFRAARTGAGENIVQMIADNSGTNVAAIRFQTGTTVAAGKMDFRTRTAAGSFNVALTIDEDQNATFTGDVVATGATVKMGVSGNSAPYLEIDDTGQSYPYQWIALGTRLSLRRNAVDFLSFEGSTGLATFTGDVTRLAAVNGAATVKAENTTDGTGARAILAVKAATISGSLIANSASYTGVAGWASAIVLSADGAATGGIIIRSSFGDINFQPNGTVTQAWIASGGDFHGRNFILTSDMRNKQNVKSIGGDFISFDMKDDKGRYGVSAQHIEKKYPSLVTEDKEGYKSVKYIDLLCMKIAQLEARLNKIEA